jgi:hypothetical protein
VRVDGANIYISWEMYLQCLLSSLPQLQRKDIIVSFIWKFRATPFQRYVVCNNISIIHDKAHFSLLDSSGVYLLLLHLKIYVQRKRIINCPFRDRTFFMALWMIIFIYFLPLSLLGFKFVIIVLLLDSKFMNSFNIYTQYVFQQSGPLFLLIIYYTLT